MFLPALGMISCNGISRPVTARSTATCSPLTETRTSTGPGWLPVAMIR